MLNLFDGESDTPELIWDGEMRGELRNIAGIELDSCMQYRRETGHGNDHFKLSDGSKVKYSKLENELYIGGIYVARFLKEPTFNMRDPTSFLEALLLRWTHELQICTENECNGEEKSSTDIIVGGKDNLQPVTDAIVYLCKIRTNLCDKLAQWGYMSRCLTFLDDTLRRDLLGSPLVSIIRILHVAVNRRVNVESIIASGANDSAHGIVAFTIRAVGETSVHPDAGFMIEMLKKLFVDALGDVQKAAEINKNISSKRMVTPMTGSHAYAMAPSPAPGEEPVSRNRVRVNMGDDPLGLGMSSTPTQATSQQSGTYINTPQNYQNTQINVMNTATQARSQMSFNQTNRPQPYSTPLQQPQQASYSQTIYSNATESTGMRQSYPIQSQQNMQSSNSYHPYMGQHTTQQQQEQSIGITSSGTQNMTVNHQAYTSYANINESTRQQQHNTTIPTNGMQLGQGIGISQTNSNVTFQPGVGSNQMYNVQNTSTSFASQASQYQQQPAAQPFFQGNQIQNQLGTAPTGIPPNDITTKPVPSTNQYKPIGDGQTNIINNAMHQQNNNIQATIHRGHVVNQPHQQPMSTHSGQNNQNYKGSNALPIQAPNVPIVETVGDVNQQDNSVSQFAAITSAQQSQPVGNQTFSSNDGLGIDARTQIETPTMRAAKEAESIPGAPNSADGRKVLLESSIRCDLPKYLIETVLENPNLQKAKDPAAVKVHSVELLKLLTKDPGYGLKFKLILEKIPAWKKYSSQDHSLFITGGEQKADYFLTDGTSSLEAKKLLQM